MRVLAMATDQRSPLLEKQQQEQTSRSLPKHVDRDFIIHDYERRLLCMKRTALVPASLLSLSAHLGSYAHLWGFLVVLGGFGSHLRDLDFCIVAALLFVEQIRNSSALSFAKLAALNIPILSGDPKFLSYSDGQSKLMSAVDSFGRIAQTLLLLPGLVVPLVRLLRLGEFGGVQNLATALLTFYVLVLAGACLASLALVFDSVCWTVLSFSPSASLKKYHNEVYRRALNSGLVDAGNFDFFAFAFKILKDDYSRNVQPLTIKKQNGDLIRYLYAHRNGAEVVSRYLQSVDAMEQQAAANMVGFWANEKNIDSQAALLSRLVDKLGASQIGWAAANSLSILAETHPELVINVRNGEQKQLLDVLIGLLNKSNPMSLVIVRIMVNLFRNESIVSSLDEKVKANMEQKLREILCESKRQRTKTLAAYALKLLGLLSGEDMKAIGQIEPEKDYYFWAEEKVMLEKLREGAGLGPYERWEKLEVREVE